MKFSICIPNYNYGRYIGETIRSALNQDADVEVLVADNASTDDSVAVVEGIGDARVHLRRNRCNVGFAGNLDRACADASGDRMILLSSDDLAGATALALYARLAKELGPAAKRAVFCSGRYVINGSGTVTEEQGLPKRRWLNSKKDPLLSQAIGATVRRTAARTLLAEAMADMRTPFYFATTCYPRMLYEAVEGYGGGALINPDKAFAWKLLSVADEVFYIDAPLFSYRVHDANQTAQQRQSGALKHLIDQYRATFDTAPEVLKSAGMTCDDLSRAFIEHDVALRGLKAVADGERHLARRHLEFGRAAYPELTAWSRRVWILRGALALGPLGTWIAAMKLEREMDKFSERKGLLE